MKRNFCSLFIATIIGGYIAASESVNKHQLIQIHEWADALNIEGGTIPKQLRQGQKWFNVATILDRPYIDGIEFDSMAKNEALNGLKAVVSRGILRSLTLLR